MTVPATVDGPTLRGGRGTTVAALVGWALLVIAAWRVGAPNGTTWKIPASPLTGEFDLHITPVTLVVAVLGIALARSLPRWCTGAPWRRVLVAVALGSLLWGGALALTRGPSGLDRALATRFEYPAVVDDVDRIGVGPFIDTFTHEEALRTYPIHIQGHPLGAALLFVGLDRIGLGGGAGAAAAILVLASTALPAVLLAVREVAGEQAARSAGPFLALMPGIVWWVTSADALFAAVAAWGIALLVLATADGATRRRSRFLAVGSGVAWGIGIHLTYGLVPLALVGVAVVVARRRWSALGWAALGGALAVAPFVAIGFWWFDGLAATKVRYVAGVASARPYGYFSLLGNPASFSLAIGPAAWVAIARVRDRGLALLALPALAAVALANASGLSKAEVERIWLPFAPWVLVLTAGLVIGTASSGRRPERPRWEPVPGWPTLAGALLLGQVALALLIESVVKTPW